MVRYMKSPNSINGNLLTIGNVYVMRTWNGLYNSTMPTVQNVTFLGYFDHGSPTSITKMKDLVHLQHTCKVQDVSGVIHTINVPPAGGSWELNGNRITFDT